MKKRRMLLHYLGLACVLPMVAGCGLGNAGTSAATASAGTPALKMTGTVHGGQNPVSKSFVQLYVAGTSGYGAGATPLIKTAVQSDGSVQSTVFTDASGNFAITGDYTCPTSTAQVYLTAVGGNPGLQGTQAGTNNTDLALVAALGNCGNLSASTNVFINEVTTVAAVWALQGFAGSSATGLNTSLYYNGGSYDGTVATPATGFSFGSSSTNTQGLANAMLVAQNLANTKTGVSPGTNTAANLTVVESSTVNLLGNVLSSCVNSVGGASGDGSNCGNLFAGVNSTGATVPQDTLQAALLIARNPTYNVANLAAMSPASGAPFNPAAATFLNDFTIGYNIGGAVQTTYNGTFASPFWIAFDTFGNAWIYNLDLDGTGGVNGQTATSPYVPYLTELDAAGNPLTTVRQYYSSGSLVSIGGGSGAAFSSNHPAKLVVDTNNNVYAGDPLSGAIFAVNGSTGAGVASAGVFTTNAVVTGDTTTAGGSNIQNMAIDGQGNLWFHSAAAGASPFATAAGYVQTFPTSTFASNTPPSSVTTVFTGGNTYGLAIDNTLASAANGAPYLYTGNSGNCTGNTTAGSPTLAVTTAYGDLEPVNTTTAGSQVKGQEAGFKAITSSGVSTTSCSTTGYPTQLANVNVTFNGTTYAAAPIAQPYAIAVDSTNSLWVMNARQQLRLPAQARDNTSRCPSSRSPTLHPPTALLGQQSRSPMWLRAQAVRFRRQSTAWTPIPSLRSPWMVQATSGPSLRASCPSLPITRPATP
jgi:hypothetical protein